MAYETTDRMVKKGVADADHMKIQTAEALEEAARKLRSADLSAKGEDVKHILHDVEDSVNQFQAEIGVKYQKIEADYHKRVEPVEHVITDHPIPSVLIASRYWCPHRYAYLQSPRLTRDHMDTAACNEEPSIESEFVRTYKFIDLYLQQKTDLFLQHYVFEPFDFLIKRIMYLSIIVTLLAAGTLFLWMGVILLIATVVPLWAALLITGVAVFITAGVIAYMLLSDKIVLKTPLATEMIKNGKP